MTKLVFSFSDVASELLAIGSVMQPFIHPIAANVLSGFMSRLDEIRKCPADRFYRWEIPESQPLQTRASCGEYEPSDHGEELAFATISCVWQIRPLGNNNSGSIPSRQFELGGLASTLVRIFEGEAGAVGDRGELAMWRMEIGDDNCPGAYFHVQVMGDSPDPPFPHSLSIPRLPGILVTPMSVIEYVVAELFQNEAKRVLSTDNVAAQRWRVIQQRRLGAVLRWQLESVSRPGSGTWTALKWAQPRADLFMLDL